jgi:transcriptional regulator with XRE-family HTH domain
MANRLRVMRADKRITQFKLSLLTGILQSKLSLIENGLIEPREDEKQKLAEALGVKPEKIWGPNRTIDKKDSKVLQRCFPARQCHGV